MLYSFFSRNLKKEHDPLSSLVLPSTFFPVNQQVAAPYVGTAVAVVSVDLQRQLAWRACFATTSSSLLFSSPLLDFLLSFSFTFSLSRAEWGAVFQSFYPLLSTFSLANANFFFFGYFCILKYPKHSWIGYRFKKLKHETVSPVLATLENEKEGETEGREKLLTKEKRESARAHKGKGGQRKRPPGTGLGLASESLVKPACRVEFGLLRLQERRSLEAWGKKERWPRRILLPRPRR